MYLCAVCLCVVCLCGVLVYLCAVGLCVCAVCSCVVGLRVCVLCACVIYPLCLYAVWHRRASVTMVKLEYEVFWITMKVDVNLWRSCMFEGVWETVSSSAPWSISGARLHQGGDDYVLITCVLVCLCTCVVGVCVFVW